MHRQGCCRLICQSHNLSFCSTAEAEGKHDATALGNGACHAGNPSLKSRMMTCMKRADMLLKNRKAAGAEAH